MKIIRSYDVYWYRLDDPAGHDIMVCTDLTPLRLVRRLIAAIKTSGPIVIERVVPHEAPTHRL